MVKEKWQGTILIAKRICHILEKHKLGRFEFSHYKNDKMTKLGKVMNNLIVNRMQHFCITVKDAEIREELWTDDGSGDIQKKITPWKESHIPGFESSEGQKSPRGHLVVVASLISRVPNLGGSSILQF